MWHIHTIKYYSALKRETLLYTTWIHLEYITVRDKNQSRRTDAAWFQLYEVSEIVGHIKAEGEWWLGENAGKGGMVNCYSVGTVSVT